MGCRKPLAVRGDRQSSCLCVWCGENVAVAGGSTRDPYRAVQMCCRKPSTVRGNRQFAHSVLFSHCLGRLADDKPWLAADRIPDPDPTVSTAGCDPIATWRDFDGVHLPCIPQCDSLRTCANVPQSGPSVGTAGCQPGAIGCHG